MSLISRNLSNVKTILVESQTLILLSLGALWAEATRMLFMPVLGYDRLRSEDMNKENESKASGILPVPRTKEEAKRSYDRISRYYDYLTGAFERKYAEMALERLSVVEGETVLEIGFGTGHCLKRIAESIGQTGKVYGIDISSGMMEITKKRLEKAGLAKGAKLYCGDAANLPFDDNTFDAVFMSFTLELFDTPEIPKVLEQIKRVLKPGGRLGVASMSKENGESIFLRLYEWIHNKWPKYVDCRPIYVEQSLIDAGYQIKSKEKVTKCTNKSSFLNPPAVGNETKNKKNSLLCREAVAGNSTSMIISCR